MAAAPSSIQDDEYTLKLLLMSTMIANMEDSYRSLLTKLRENPNDEKIQELVEDCKQRIVHATDELAEIIPGRILFTYQHYTLPHQHMSIQSSSQSIPKRSILNRARNRLHHQARSKPLSGSRSTRKLSHHSHQKSMKNKNMSK